MIDKILIERKLGNIEEFLKELDAAPVGSADFTLFVSNLRGFLQRESL